MVGPAVDALEARLCELSPCRRQELRLTSQKDQSTEDVGVHMQLMPLWAYGIGFALVEYGSGVMKTWH